MSVSYNASYDRLVARFGPTKKLKSKKFGPFELWWDEESTIRAIAIDSFRKQSKEFARKQGWVRLGGIWQGISIDEKDIKEVRRELLDKLEKRLDKF